MAGVATSAANVDTLRFDEQAGTPSTPAAGFSSIYTKTDGLYIIDDAGTVTGPMMEISELGCFSATFTVGGEAGDAINVAIQLEDHAGSAINLRASVLFYLADDATGDTVSATAPDGGIAIGTDGAMIEWTANLSGLLISEADGDIDITFSESGAATWYLILIMPTGKLEASAAITFT